MKTGKEGRTMSGKGVESVEVKSRNKSGRCPFRERKRGKRASGGRRDNARGKGRKCVRKERTCREIVEIYRDKRETDRVAEGGRKTEMCGVHEG